MLTLGRVFASTTLKHAASARPRLQPTELPLISTSWASEVRLPIQLQSVISFIENRASRILSPLKGAPNVAKSAVRAGSSSKPLFRVSNSILSSQTRNLIRKSPLQTHSTRATTNWSFQNSYRHWNSPNNFLHFSWSKPLATLIVINVGVYITWLAIGSVQKGRKWMTENFMVSSSTWKTHPWTLITAAFSHSSLIHLGFNMLAIGTIGRDLQQVMGPRAFLAFFGMSAVASSFAHLWWSGSRMPENWQPRAEVVPLYLLADGTPLTASQAEAYTKVHGAPPQRLQYVFHAEDHVWSPALGASGVASGLFAISATLWPRRNFWVMFFTVPASRLFFLFTAFSVGSLLINPESHIGHAAHLGGAAMGLAAAVLMRGRPVRF